MTKAKPYDELFTDDTTNGRILGVSLRLRVLPSQPEQVRNAEPAEVSLIDVKDRN